MSPSSHAEIQLGRIPSGDLLKGLPEFGSGKASEGAEVGRAVANILSQLGEGKSVCKPPTSTVQKLVPMESGLASLPKKLVDRIVSGQYVDFSELPPAKGWIRSMPNTEEGHIVVIRAEDLAGTRKN